MPPKKKGTTIVIRNGPNRARFSGKGFKAGKRKYKARSLNPLPESRMVKLRYVEEVTLNPPGTATTYNFSCNSLYDPNTTGIGHQPLMYDMMATLYDHYIVLGAKITAHFWCELADQNYVGVVGIKLNDDLSMMPTGGIQNAIEHGNKYTKYKYLRLLASGDKTQATVTHKYSAKKFHGVKDTRDNRNHLGAAVTGSPEEQAYFTLFYGHTDGSTDVNLVRCQVVIDYIVEFSEPRDQAQS